MVYFILGGTTVFVNILTFAEVPQKLIHLVETYQLGPTHLILVMLAILAVLDVMMEPVPMLFLVVPITSKAIFTAGIHWITFNFLLLQYSAVMFCTPPLAMSLFALAQHFKVRIEDVTKGVIPFLIVLYLHLIIFLFFPEWLLWLPRLVFGNRVDLPVQF